MNAMSEKKKEKLTILASAGRLPLQLMEAVHNIAKQYDLDVYLTAAQNIRLTGIDQEQVEVIRQELTSAGARLKKAGIFSLPAVCTGPGQCKFAVVNPVELNDKILARFGQRENVKAKIKLAISGCNLCCSNAKLVDIGIIATRRGFEVYAGGKGGSQPKVGRRIARQVTADKVLDIIAELVDFHDRKTLKKQRMFKLLCDPEFPYQEI